MGKATAVAHPNIAFIKYWGKAPVQGAGDLNLPANPSLSMNLAALSTITTVEYQTSLPDDLVTIDGQPATGFPLARVVAHLDRVRSLSGIDDRAQVVTGSNFPIGTGLASSASGFAALSMAATRAAGLELEEGGLSRLARLGSGSACRSVPAGFTLWDGNTDETSFARQVAPPEYWDLRDVIAVVSDEQKPVGSYEGHRLADSSPLHTARLAAVPSVLAIVLASIEQRDLTTLGPAIEADALAMHGVMMTSRPSLLYWQPATVTVLQGVRAWRQEGLWSYCTIDAGPNVHCICDVADAAEIERRLRQIMGVRDVLVSGAGGGVRLAIDHLF
jgi:diphosphomevalonate decarboxylase